jgi:hypothetical protein
MQRSPTAGICLTETVRSTPNAQPLSRVQRPTSWELGGIRLTRRGGGRRGRRGDSTQRSRRSRDRREQNVSTRSRSAHRAVNGVGLRAGRRSWNVFPNTQDPSERHRVFSIREFVPRMPPSAAPLTAHPLRSPSLGALCVDSPLLVPYHLCARGHNRPATQRHWELAHRQGVRS